MATITAEAAGGVDVTAFLETIRWSEGSDYNTIVTGISDPDLQGHRHPTPETFTDFSQHPFANGRPPKLIVPPGTRFPNGLRSDASGGYQFMLKTWQFLQTKLSLPDFSPLSQDLAAIELLRERGALAHLKNGNIDKAIAAHFALPPDLADAIEEDASIWASLPGNTYGQDGHSMAAVVAQYEKIWSGSFLSA